MLEPRWKLNEKEKEKAKEKVKYFDACKTAVELRAQIGEDDKTSAKYMEMEKKQEECKKRTEKFIEVMEKTEQEKTEYFSVESEDFNGTYLEIVHRCNQYNMIQKLIVKLPDIKRSWLRWNTWESVGTLIPLDMGDKEVKYKW